MSSKNRTLSPAARAAAELLGALVRQGRQDRRWTQADLAERIGVSEATLSKVERGDPGVALGTAFEAAAIVGVPLFDQDPARVEIVARRAADRLALLPSSVRRRSDVVDDDF